MPGDLDGLAYVDGTIVPIAEARVSVLDRGFLWGDGVYEITPCFHGTPFRLERHLARLEASLRFVGIPSPMPLEELAATTLRLVELNRAVTSAHAVCRVGHWVTRGIERWVPPHERGDERTVCIVVQPAGPWPGPDAYRTGVALTIVATRRSPPSVLDPRVKTTSRLNPIVAELEGAARGSLALMLDLDDHLAEGPTFNVFLVREGRLVTPRSEHVLPGITREAVLELAAGLGIPAGEADLTPSDVAAASEAFVTASTWGVLPVRAVDRLRPRGPVPGELTVALTERLAELTGHHPLRPRSAGGG